jgi:hypothetical protein
MSLGPIIMIGPKVGRALWSVCQHPLFLVGYTILKPTLGRLPPITSGAAHEPLLRASLSGARAGAGIRGMSYKRTSGFGKFFPKC